MDAAIRMVVSPRATTPICHASGDSVETYLLKCKQNIEAEIWSLVSSSGNRQAIKVVVEDDVIMSVLNAGVYVLHEQLRYTLIMLNGVLCLITRSRGLGMGYEVGVYRQPHGSFLIGYVKPFLVEYAAILGYISGGKPAILKDIATLSRTPFAFEQRPFSETVASNSLQRQSVLGLQYTVEGIQGPPGTGKSSTIFHIVNSALPLGMDCIVTCVQNRAVDALAHKFQSSAVRFLVIGSADRLGDTAKQHTLDSLVLKASAVVAQQAVVDWVSRVLEYLHSCQKKRESTRRFKCSGWIRWWAAYSKLFFLKDLDTWSSRRVDANSALRDTKAAVSDSIATNATVFMCTVDTLFRVGVSKKRRILIIDEAGTVPEYKMPLAVSLGIVAVIAVGDQNQLQPFTHTDVSNGFFHRLAKGVVPSMLEEQFRMHPEICKFVSSSFYANRLITNPLISDARCAVPSAGVQWVDYPDVNAETISRHGAIFNQVELDMLKTFMINVEKEFLVHGKTVMIIAFYREQFHLLMHMGEKLGLVGTRVVEAKSEKYFIHPLFRISTVDASQGSEADVVVLSCVRCNAKKQIGFLSQTNRMCVALSRARERLIIVGSSKTLLPKSSIWKALFQVSRVCTSFVERPSPFDLWDHCWDALTAVPV